MIRVEKLRALLAKATPGEWDVQHEHDGGAGDRRSMVMAETPLHGHDVIGIFDDERVSSQCAKANAELIVAMRNSINELLDVADAAQHWADSDEEDTRSVKVLLTAIANLEGAK
jgi:hypothetical protein